MKKKDWNADRTMINIKRTTKAELEKVGNMRDSFDDVVMKLVKFWNESNQKNKSSRKKVTKKSSKDLSYWLDAEKDD